METKWRLIATAPHDMPLTLAREGEWTNAVGILRDNDDWELTQGPTWWRNEQVMSPAQRPTHWHEGYPHVNGTVYDGR